jgi:hypothetical protein
MLPAPPPGCSPRGLVGGDRCAVDGHERVRARGLDVELVRPHMAVPHARADHLPTKQRLRAMQPTGSDQADEPIQHDPLHCSTGQPQASALGIRFNYFLACLIRSPNSLLH